MTKELEKNEEVQDDLENSEQEDSKTEDMPVEMLDQKISSGGKPKYEKNTKAEIVSTEWKMIKGESVDAKGKKYLKFQLTVACVDETGQTTYDNYGGGRKYVEDGAIWIGPKSQLGKLKALAKETFEFGDSLKEFSNELLNKKVLIKTIQTVYQNKSYDKNIITTFNGE